MTDSIPHPKFQIGEEVIIVSQVYPSLNGEYVVEDIQKHSTTYQMTCKWANVPICNGGELFSYKLRGLSYQYNSGATGYGFRESSLRKKHKPADEDFQEWLKGVLNTEKNTIILQGVIRIKNNNAEWIQHHPHQ